MNAVELDYYLFDYYSFILASIAAGVRGDVAQWMGRYVTLISRTVRRWPEAMCSLGCWRG